MSVRDHRIVGDECLPNKALHIVRCIDASHATPADDKEKHLLATTRGLLVAAASSSEVPSSCSSLTGAAMASAEAALTGESVPIDKMVDAIELKEGQLPKQVPLGDRKNMCFSATLIAQGSGVGIVVSTGDYTEIGTINKLVNNVENGKKRQDEQANDHVTVEVSTVVY